MPCEEYREALSEAAAAGSEQVMPRELRGHLDACAVCHEFFSQEQQLFAAIDGGVRQEANAEVPASLLPRVRADIETAANGRSRRMPMLVFASAAVAVAITVSAVLRFGRNASEDQVKQIAAAPVREARQVTPDPSETPRAAAIPALHSRRPRPGGNSGAQRFALFGQLEVIVPSDERDALARFIAVRQEESDLAVRLTVPAPDQPYVAMELAPLEIGDLPVTPPERAESEAPDSTERNH